MLFLIGILVKHLYYQRGKIDSIADNVSSTDINVESGLEELKEAHRLSFKYTPIVIGATVGLLLGGPFGLIPGFKLGGVFTASGCSVFGGWLGYKAQKW